MGSWAMWGIPDAAAAWAKGQPGMRPWWRARKRLAAQIDRWIAAYGAAACGRHLQTAEPLYASCANRLWNCWQYHWQQAAELGGGLADGFEVAARLEQGLGFRGGGQLGGNPLEDVVLATAVAAGDPHAKERFCERFRERAIALAKKTHPFIDDPDDWWCQFWVHLVGVGERPGKLAKYSGHCGLWNWLARVIINQSRQPLDPLPHHGPLRETIPAPESQGVEDRDCLKLLGDVVRTAINRLRPDEATLLYLFYVEGMSGMEVAAVLGVHPGTVSRRKAEAVGRLAEELAALDASSSQAMGYHDCLEILARARNLRELGDIFLRALTDSQQTEGRQAEGSRERQSDS